MKALKVILGVVAFLVLGGGGAVFFLLRAPSDADLCGHLKDMMKKEVGAAADSYSTEACIKDIKPSEYDGALHVAATKRCMMAAQSTKELTACK